MLNWTPTGVGNMVPVLIDDSQRKQLTLAIRNHGIEKSIPNAFFDAIGFSVGAYHSGSRIAAHCTPAQVRRNLTQTIDSALKLNDKFNDLDGLSRALLPDATGGIEVALLQENLKHTILALTKALNLAKQYRGKGRLKEFHRLDLATHVADAIEVHLCKKPTSTRDGLYESVLSIALEIASGDTVKEVNNLVRQALKQRKQPDHTIPDLPCFQPD